MADYELYGDYNNGEDAPDEGPPPSRAWVWTVRVVRILCICITVAAVGTLLFRIFYAGYYPASIKRLHYTDSLRAYAEAGGDMSALTQEISAPFESSDAGYFCADNLIVIRGAGALQCTIRLNKSAIEDIAREYELSGFGMRQDAFRFVLEDNTGYSDTADPTAASASASGSYEATDVFFEEKPLYYYVKVCFDGVNFEDVKWMRLLIYIDGVTYKPDGSDVAKICIYENNERYSYFEEYRLSKKEREFN